ncbi:MAG: phenylalanyl-tRNA synthase subunit alpha [Candidatus Entotheonella factor]|uniref:Phenylalanine--tRNA ligase alpha subunit n=1 Tax=Entotheonella factor TaxID=1429438 RepID=W4LF26_ENTF1|nr:MAG: phenylalanyl-tRNA synthase subunit alpha [Candidatus Entotheonella factor]
MPEHDNPLVAELETVRTQALDELDTMSDLTDLDAWRIQYLGRRGALTQVMRGIGQLPPQQRPEVGQVSNDVKTTLETAFDHRVDVLKQQRLATTLAQERLDVTLPGFPVSLGRLHPTTQILREITSIFAEMGFQVYDSREVESDLYNFELLNIPPYHPARDMWDTFYINERVVLRTHTSPGQIRAMQAFHPDPIRVILPGMCYRYEQVTSRHEMMFTQVEGLAVGENITMADLKGVLENFARRLFGDNRRMRFRCSHFPFTEPSVEVDMDCFLCNGEGTGCSMCKESGWLEILGAGMVHPQVLRNGGYDPTVYSGFAFGMGPERITILKYGIDDIRLFFSNDLRFLEQFS